MGNSRVGMEITSDAMSLVLPHDSVTEFRRKIVNDFADLDDTGTGLIVLIARNRDS